MHQILSEPACYRSYIALIHANSRGDIFGINRIDQKISLSRAYSRIARLKQRVIPSVQHLLHLPS